MHFARRSIITMLLIAVLLTACGGQIAAGQPTPDINATVAAAAETLAVSLFQTQTALAPTITNTAPPTVTPLASNTPLALPSPLPSATQQILFYASPVPTGTFYTLTPSSSSLAVGCNNLRLIEAYTSTSGSLTPGQNFTQYWQVENNGTCNWVYLYHLVHASGEKMGGSPGRLGKVIPSGKWTTLAVDLTAPSKEGTYNAAWRFSDQGGTPFGASLPVAITVKKNPDPTNTPSAPTATPNLQQTADAANTALAGQQAAQTQTAAAQTAISVGQTAISAAATSAAATATCGTLTALGTPCP